MSELIIKKIEEFAQSLLPSMDLELVEVQFRREEHGWVLRVFIDNEEGISVDHCADVSREVSYFLDVEDLIDHPFNLEVSSPGLERPLRTLEDFNRFVGRTARVKLREPIDDQKVLTGVIQQVGSDSFEMLLKDECSVQVEFEKIRKARLTI